MTLFANEQDNFALWVNDQVRIGGVLSSFYRSVPENIAAGGDVDSQHLLGLAADFDQQLTAPVVLEQISTEALRRGYVVVNEGDHLHVQRFRAGFLQQCGVPFPVV